MNVFVLSTGRCGSTTFVEACRHMTNYSAAHESRVHRLGDARLNYGPNHIESDNRLSWFLGRLDKHFGDAAFYVHLYRERVQTARSFSKRLTLGLMMSAYARGIYLELPEDIDPFEVALDYYDTVTANIEAFLHNKSNQMTIALDNIQEDFAIFWNRIGAEGDLVAAIKEWEVAYNASDGTTGPMKHPPYRVRAVNKIRRILAQLPEFLREA